VEHVGGGCQCELLRLDPNTREKEKKRGSLVTPPPPPCSTGIGASPPGRRISVGGEEGEKRGKRKACLWAGSAGISGWRSTRLQDQRRKKRGGKKEKWNSSESIAAKSCRAGEHHLLTSPAGTQPQKRRKKEKKGKKTPDNQTCPHSGKVKKGLTSLKRKETITLASRPAAWRVFRHMAAHCRHGGGKRGEKEKEALLHHLLLSSTGRCRSTRRLQGGREKERKGKKDSSGRSPSPGPESAFECLFSVEDVGQNGRREEGKRGKRKDALCFCLGGACSLVIG